MHDQLQQLTYFRGRVAMAAILRGLGIQKGDEILIQAFTCIAVPEAVKSLGAIPRYVDVEAGTPHMDPRQLESRIGQKTRAVVVQHSFGLPAKIGELSDIARKASIPVIEDCAHTIDSRVHGRRVGSFGVGAFYSFEASKPVFIGIGGSAVLNDAEVANRVTREYAEYAEPSSGTQAQLATMRLAHRVAYRPSTYWTVRTVFRSLVKVGLIKGNYNKLQDDYRPSEDFSRKMGRVQAKRLGLELQNLEANTRHRKWVANEYRNRISREGVTHFEIDEGVEPVFGRYPLLVQDKEKCIEGARRAKVELADFYDTPVHPLRGDGLRRFGYESGSCPNAEWISRHVVSLPTGAQVDAAQIARAAQYFNG